MSATPRSWTRDELILTLELYFKLGGVIPDVKDSRIIALSADLADFTLLDHNKASEVGRNKSAIIFKLSNFRSLDPTASEKGLKGFPNIAKLDKEIWEEFYGDRDKLIIEADRIRDSIHLVRETSEPLKANIHLLRLVGDELIGSLPLAVFELVKNAYDADAENVIVKLDLEVEEPYVTVKDDGCGMDLETIRRGWLQLGGPLKRERRQKRTGNLQRIPLGEKGVGRLAAYKLGNKISLVTKPEHEKMEYLVVMDLEELLEEGFASDTSVEDVRVKIESRTPKIFTGKSHGTEIRIDSLRQQDYHWGRRQVRDLHRMITTLVNPFLESSTIKTVGGFKPELIVPGHGGWLKGLLNLEDILGRAIYRLKFSLDDNARITWDYKFLPPIQLKMLQPSSDNRSDELLDLIPSEEDKKNKESRITLGSSLLDGIGPINGELHVFDRSNNVLKFFGSESNQVKNFLDEQGGIRIYRKDIRVYNYGEPGDDWLGLNAERVNKPGQRLSTNSVIGAITLEDESSKGLKEKTNREGFDQNSCYRNLLRIVSSVIDFFNRIRQKDRNQLDKAVKRRSISDPTSKFYKNIKELNRIAKEKGLEKEFEPRLKKIAEGYDTMQNAALGAAAGLNLALIFHETERSIRGLVTNIKKGVSIEILKKQASDLERLLTSLASLLKQGKPRIINARQFLENAKSISENRFTAHKIIFSCPALTGEDEDFQFFGAYNHYLSAIVNLIDNAIFWVRRANEEHDKVYYPAISIRTLIDWDTAGPCIAILDNGPGFTIDPILAQQPFVTNKAGGMGLGLYFAKMVMETQGGQLIIPSDSSELDLDNDSGKKPGAAVVMQFKRT